MTSILERCTGLDVVSIRRLVLCNYERADKRGKVDEVSPVSLNRDLIARQRAIDAELSDYEVDIR